MTHWKQLRDNKHLGWWDIEAHGEVTVTIEDVIQGELALEGTSQTERKPLLKFAGKQKTMVLNATNAKTLEALYGPHVEGWRGKRVTIYVGKTSFGKQRNINCLRIKNVVPNASE